MRNYKYDPYFYCLHIDIFHLSEAGMLESVKAFNTKSFTIKHCEKSNKKRISNYNEQIKKGGFSLGVVERALNH